MQDDKLEADLISKVFDHHKNHARFEETQRSLFVAAYFTVSGVLATGIFNAFVKNGQLIAEARNILSAILIFHIVFTAFVAFAVGKMSGEFRRHFQQAEAILRRVSALNRNEKLSEIISHARLETAGNASRNWKNKVAGFLGVAAMYNYILTIFFATDAVLATALLVSTNCFVLLLTGVVALVVGFYTQHRYIKFVEAL